MTGLSCHCTDCQEFFANNTCEVKSGGQCFTAVEREPDGTETWGFGCLPPVDREGGMILQVRNFEYHSSSQLSIECSESVSLESISVKSVMDFLLDNWSDFFGYINSLRI